MKYGLEKQISKLKTNNINAQKSARFADFCALGSAQRMKWKSPEYREVAEVHS
ncbi:hypothetical protein [Paenibacillus dokdonensis]|uniref:hypothetical protein n=1 Tax=Paenibacillus dokdonensis TaxID=2567944 RepID=UPI001457C9C7|nr:hypothetical protein [Paenibacillus dokdonensis]